MTLNPSNLAAITLTASLACIAMPAQAQSVAWVASNGSGSACTRTAPCGSFSTAIAAAGAGGLVSCIDSGIYNAAFIISVPITIDCRGTHAIVRAITVDTAGIAVILRGISFEQQSTFETGISITAHAKVLVDDCTIAGYKDAFVNSGFGVYLRPTGSGTSRLTLTNVRITDNDRNGVHVDGTASSSPIHVSVRDSVISGNFGSGIVTNTSATTEIRLMVINTEISKNGIGVNSNGGLSHVIVGRSTITENQVGFATAGQGAIYSYGTNEINGNNNDNVNVSTLISQN